MKRLDTKAKYRQFINERDRLAERFLMKARAQVADEFRRFMQQAHDEFLRSYYAMNREFADPVTQRRLNLLDNALERISRDVAHAMVAHWRELRRLTFALAQAGEQQAKINVAGGEPRKVPKEEIAKEVHDPTEFGAIEDRTLLALSRVRRDLMDSVEMSLTMGEDVPAASARFLKTFPAPERVVQKRVMRRLVREAEQPRVPGKEAFGFSEFIDEDEWQEILRAYKTQYVPKWRDPRSGQLESPVSVGESEEVAVYPWQLEREITDDFVTRVNNGTHEGAKAQGITDFVWIAIVDDRTDDCCLKRDGLTVTEIRAKLKGEWADDKCRASVPPAHPNCRCRVAPATGDLPEVPESNEADFYDWLNS